MTISSIASAPSPSSADDDEDDDDDDDDEEEEEGGAPGPSPAGAAKTSTPSSAGAPSSLSPKDALRMVSDASKDPGVEAAANEIASAGDGDVRHRLPRLPRPGDPLPPLQKGKGLVYSSVG